MSTEGSKSSSSSILYLSAELAPVRCASFGTTLECGDPSCSKIAYFVKSTSKILVVKPFPEIKTSCRSPTAVPSIGLEEAGNSIFQYILHILTADIFQVPVRQVSSLRAHPSVYQANSTSSGGQDNLRPSGSCAAQLPRGSELGSNGKCKAAKKRMFMHVRAALQC